MAEVCLLSVSDVYPKTPTPQPCWRELSIIDYMSSTLTYTKQIYYYKEVSHNDFALLVSKLKESLSRTLDPYFPLAGRVEEDKKSGKLLINCNDAGVPFGVALAECRLADWSNLQDCPIEDKLIPKEDYVTNYGEARLVQVQVTKFLCGSIALGYAVSEIVVDGYSGMEFMKSWADMHKTGKIPNLPLFNVELFEPRNPPMVNVPIRDYRAIPPNFKVFDESLPCPYKSKLFTFTAESIEALVKEIHCGPYGSGFRATSYEAMAGLVWKCMTEARELADDETTIYLFPISLRGNINRWEPLIPANYFGNAVHFSCLPARAGDIKAKHLSYTAQLVHEDIQQFSAEGMKSAVDWMQMQMEKGLKVGFNCDLYGGKDVHGTSMYIFPIYDTDFGWGRPMHFSMIVHPWFGDGVAFMLPTPQGGRSRYLLVGLPGEQLNKLSTHPLFLAFATPTKVSTAP